MTDTCYPSDDCCLPSGEPFLPVTGSPEDEAELALIAKALGHPMRVRILRILAERRACQCGELVAELPISQATVSQHLKMLKEAGLVQGEIDGSRVCYCASAERLGRLEALLGLVREGELTNELEVLAV
jgi:DNA-binding transcriptional ArsR family regulator